MQNEDYPSGSPAIRFGEDGAGIVFYDSEEGQSVVAACVSRASSYQFKHYFYDETKPGEQPMLLGSLDERIIGFMSDKAGNKILFSKDGGRIVASTGDITKRWSWNGSMKKKGDPPSSFDLQLNDFLHFHFSDRASITVRFSSGSVKHEFDCGEKFRRTDTYLEKLSHNGKLIMECPSLMQRQKAHVEAMKSKKMLVNPSSADITNQDVSDVISDLESYFDPYRQKIKDGDWIQPFSDPCWKTDALSKTLREVPQHRLKIHRDSSASAVSEDPLSSTAKLAGVGWKDGRLLDELEVREELRRQNPVLSRTAILQRSSGRYSVDAAVPSRGASLKKLPRVSGGEFSSVVLGGSKDELILVACLHQTDPLCNKVDQWLQIVNGELAMLAEKGTPKPFRLMWFNMAESSFMATRYKIRSLPYFLMFVGGKLVYAGMLGGAPVRLPLASVRPRVLLMEPNFADQIVVEKTLKRGNYDWDLAFRESDAMSHIRRVSEAQRGYIGAGKEKKHDPYSIVLFGSELASGQIESINRQVIAASSGHDHVLTVIAYPIGTVPLAPGKCEVCRKAHSKGGHASSADIKSSTGETDRPTLGCPHCSFIASPSPELLRGGVAKFALVKPLKPASMLRLVQEWRVMRFADAAQEGEAAHFGLSRADFMRRLESEFANSSRRGAGDCEVSGIQLTAEDTVAFGRRLISKKD